MITEIKTDNEIINIDRIELYKEWFDEDPAKYMEDTTKILHLASTSSSDLINLIKYANKFDIPHGKYENIIKSNLYDKYTLEEVKEYSSTQLELLESRIFPTLSTSEDPADCFFGMLKVDPRFLIIFKVPKGYKQIHLYDSKGNEAAMIKLGLMKDSETGKVKEEKKQTKLETKILYDEIGSDKIIYFLLNSSGNEVDVSLVNIAWDYSFERLRNKPDYVLRQDYFQESVISQKSSSVETPNGLFSRGSGNLLGNKKLPEEQLPWISYKKATLPRTDTWLPRRKYHEGDTVLWKGTSWVSTVNGNLGNEPNFSPHWTKKDFFERSQYRTLFVRPEDSIVSIVPSGVVSYPASNEGVTFTLTYPSIVHLDLRNLEYEESKNPEENQGLLRHEITVKPKDDPQIIFRCTYDKNCCYYYRFVEEGKEEPIEDLKDSSLYTIEGDDLEGINIDYLANGSQTIEGNYSGLLRIGNELATAGHAYGLSAQTDLTFSMIFNRKYTFEDGETKKNFTIKDIQKRHTIADRIIVKRIPCSLSILSALPGELAFDIDLPTISDYKYGDEVSFLIHYPYGDSEDLNLEKIHLYLFPEKTEYNQEDFIFENSSEGIDVHSVNIIKDEKTGEEKPEFKYSYRIARSGNKYFEISMNIIQSANFKIIYEN